MQEAVRRRLEIIGNVAPPIIDEYIEVLARLDVVPPQGGNVDRIARLELGTLRNRGCLGKSWKTHEVRIAHVYQADRLARRGQIERTDVQIFDLVGRKHGEAAPSAHHAGQVFGIVEMRRNARAVPNPDRFEHRLDRHQGASVLRSRKTRKKYRQGYRTPRTVRPR